MRQWLLRKTGWHIAETHHVRILCGGEFLRWETHLLYEKNRRFKTIKIKGKWDIYPD